MKKGQRPCRHSRRIHTKHGRKVVTINPNIRKRSRRSRNKDYYKEFGIKDSNVEEIERRLKQQEDMNIFTEKSQLEELEKELKPTIEHVHKQKQKEVSSKIDEYRKEEELRKSERERRESDRFAYKKLKELERLGLQIERKRKGENKLEYYNGLNIDSKLDRAEKLAKQSGNPENMSTAKKMRAFFEGQILEPKYEKKELTPMEARMYEVGKQMLAMPEVKKPIDLTQHSLTFKEQEEIAKKMTKRMEDEERKLKSKEDKISSLQKKAKSTKFKERNDILDFAKKAKKEAEKEQNLTASQRKEMNAKIQTLKKIRELVTD